MYIYFSNYKNHSNYCNNNSNIYFSYKINDSTFHNYKNSAKILINEIGKILIFKIKHRFNSIYISKINSDSSSNNKSRSKNNNYNNKQ